MTLFRRLCALVCLCGLCAGLLCAQGVMTLQLPALFTDNMILQRDKPLPVWGTATPGEQVTVAFRGREKAAAADAQGKWKVQLPPGEAGGPFEMTVTGRTRTIVLRNVLVGEVWLCSGQSNMEMSVAGALDGAKEAAGANYPMIRLFTVAKTLANQPKSDLQGQWTVCTPDTVKGFSAVGYFFGRELHRKLQVPVGLINCSWSGTPAETWVSRGTLESSRILRPIMKRYFERSEDFQQAKEAFQKAYAAWEKRLPRDPGNTGEANGWADLQCDMRAWGVMQAPVSWERADPALYIDGAVWFRKEVEIPKEWTGKALTLQLGVISDYDTTYFNGVKVGATGAETPKAEEVSRQYAVPAELVHPGRAVITVRIFDNFGESGFRGKDTDMRLALKDAPADNFVSLAGAWRYRIEHLLYPEPPPNEPVAPDSSWSPSKVYNGMIAPLVPFAFRGVIWYQGESNGARAYQYRTLLPALITDWRKAWRQGNFPFLYVQLPNWLHRQEIPDECPWAELRESQLLTLNVPNTGMAVTIDIGEGDNIHPRNKQEVGRRLSLAALAIAYREKIVFSGPIYRSMSVKGNKVRLRFEHTDGGLQARNGGTLTGFAIAGADRHFVWAKAEIDGDAVVVWSDEILKPAAVRYAWHYNPDCNLINGAGLPASPFRTDDWPLLTRGVD